MRAPTASELLAVWERCTTRTPGERALDLLELCGDGGAPVDTGFDTLAAGERDVRLLELHERLFGPALRGAAHCSGCDEAVEFTLRTDELRLRRPSEPGPERLAVDGYELLFRLPTAGDLAAISREPDAAAARSRLVERCVLEARRAGGEVAPAALPGAVLEALDERMAAVDPQGDVELVLACPSCGHEWSAVFDAGAFVWNEVDAWARRLLHDVHVLASAYGWEERDILALGPRRRVYLELAGG